MVGYKLFFNHHPPTGQIRGKPGQKSTVGLAMFDGHLTLGVKI